MTAPRPFVRLLCLFALVALPGLSSAATPDPTATAQLRLQFGAGGPANPGLRLGLVSHSAASGADHFTGLDWSRAGVAPMVLGLRPTAPDPLAANGDDTSLPWRWIAAAAVAIVAVTALSGSDSGDEDDNRASRADRECELVTTDGNNTNIISGNCP